ncbi:hypothetical protein [Chitinophaga solisilvae]|uniref:hypothetical protein n=1 Tax=Chitinophaga solisilvae TaxID=1233460 RepID=UPI00136B78C2|nr:hypothetical protein [Chitinophaga solisilvae]
MLILAVVAGFMGCKKDDATTRPIPVDPVIEGIFPVAEVSAVTTGSPDSLRFKISYVSSGCARLGKFFVRDSAKISLVDLEKLPALPNTSCLAGIIVMNTTYSIKKPVPGTYYFRWGSNNIKIDTVVVR